VVVDDRGWKMQGLVSLLYLFMMIHFHTILRKGDRFLSPAALDVMHAAMP
jgi:hypothetical protein